MIGAMAARRAAQLPAGRAGHGSSPDRILLLTAVNVVFRVSIGFTALASLRQPFDALHDRPGPKARTRELEWRGLPAEETERIPDAELPVCSLTTPGPRGMCWCCWRTAAKSSRPTNAPTRGMCGFFGAPQ